MQVEATRLSNLEVTAGRRAGGSSTSHRTGRSGEPWACYLSFAEPPRAEFVSTRWADAIPSSRQADREPINPGKNALVVICLW